MMFLQMIQGLCRCCIRENINSKNRQRICNLGLQLKREFTSMMGGKQIDSRLLVADKPNVNIYCCSSAFIKFIELLTLEFKCSIID